MLRGERADVTDFFLMTLVDTSVVKHNMLKKKAMFIIQDLTEFWNTLCKAVAQIRISQCSSDVLLRVVLL